MARKTVPAAQSGRSGSDTHVPPPLPSTRQGSAARSSPRLAVVRAPDADKKVWPFAPGELVMDEADLRARTAGAPHPAAKDLEVTGRRRSAPGIAPGPSGPVRESVRSTPTPHGALAQKIALPLPPATESWEGMSAPRFRRDESVIAAAVAARGGFSRVHAAAVRASTDVLGVVQSASSAALSVLGERSIAAVRRFESLPRKQQVLWVAAPYAVVLALILALVELREPATAATIQPAEQIPIAAVPARAADPLPAQPASGAAPVVPASAAAQIAAPEPAAIKAPEAARERLPREWRTLPVSAALRAKPDPAGTKVAKLKAGSKVVVYPAFPARDGWVLAQRASGEVGFLSRERLDAPPAAAVTPAPRPAKKAAASPRRVKKPDPFTELRRTRAR